MSGKSNLSQLKKELVASRPKELMTRVLTDDQWCSKALVIEKKKLYDLIDNSEMSDVTPELKEQVAGFIHESLKDLWVPGRSAVERGGILIETVTSLLNEDKDVISIEDKVRTLMVIRSLQNDLLPKEKQVDPKTSRNDNGIKGFTPGKNGVEPVPEEKKKPNPFVADIEKAIVLMDKDDLVSGTPDEIGCADRICNIIKTSKLKKDCGCREKSFSDWAAEQIYKLSPSIKELVLATEDVVELVEKMFSIWLENLKVNDSVAYLRYVDDVANGIDTEPIEDSTAIVTVVPSQENVTEKTVVKKVEKKKEKPSKPKKVVTLPTTTQTTANTDQKSSEKKEVSASETTNNGGGRICSSKMFMRAFKLG